jgi:hypothetical protein
MHLQPDERVLIVLPLFHMNALFDSLAGTLAAGCAMIIVPRFSASSFWTTAVETGATEVNIIEAIGTILAHRPRGEFRPGHRIRKVYGVRHGVAHAFREEFGIPHLVGGYIAGAELDRVIGAHPAVQEAAAIAVPSELGEDEILVAVAAKPGCSLSAEEIAQWCRERLAPMKVPRFVAILNELPHTPTHKVAKAVLRADRTLVARAVDLGAAVRALSRGAVRATWARMSIRSSSADTSTTPGSDTHEPAGGFSENRTSVPACPRGPCGGPGGRAASARGTRRWVRSPRAGPGGRTASPSPTRSCPA